MAKAKIRLSRPLVACPQCRCLGKVPMSDKLHVVLEALANHGEGTAEDVWCWIYSKRVKIVGVTCINNRLAQLHELGYLGRHKQGKFWRYWLCAAWLETLRVK